MNREAQGAVLFLIGAAMLRASFSGLYLRYVKPGLRPLLLATAVVLIVAAVATVWYEVRRARAARQAQAGQEAPEHHECHDEHGGHDGHGHGHGHREPRVAWLLMLPLFALILVAPPALGSYSAMRTGTALQRPWGFPTLPAGNPLPLTVPDYAGRAAYDHGHSLGDRRVEMEGFVSLDRNGTAYLIRMVLNCCAADAQPIKVGLAGRVPAGLKPDSWLQVIGTYTSKETRDPVNDGIIPFVDISQAKTVPAPGDQYESPE